MTMQRIFGCAILNIRETALQATQSSQDRRDELDVRLAVPSAQSACGMEDIMTNILVCDDDKEIVEAIEIYLAQEGYNVIKAYDGEPVRTARRYRSARMWTMITITFGCPCATTRIVESMS